MGTKGTLANYLDLSRVFSPTIVHVVPFSFDRAHDGSTRAMAPPAMLRYNPGNLGKDGLDPRTHQSSDDTTYSSNFGVVVVC
jgi:hypothetical protein